MKRWLLLALAGRPVPAEAEAEYTAFQGKYEAEVRPFFATGKQGSLETKRGVTLRYISFAVPEAPGALVVLPGKGEPFLKYAELLYDLRNLGLSLYALDHRGMGLSQRLLADRRKVHVDRFTDYLDDIVVFLDKVVQPHGHRRAAVLAHSTGALIAARFIQEHPGRIAAAVLCSPAFALNTAPLPTGLVRFLARRLDRPDKASDYGPGQEHFVRTPFGRNVITHSYARWRLWEEQLPAEHPDIVLGGVTRRWLREVMDAGALSLRRAESVRDPVLLVAAGSDQVVRERAEKRFCQRCAACTFLLLPEARHEILIEADGIRAQALERIESFLRSHLCEPVPRSTA